MRNLSAPGLKYVWIFGDGYTDTAANPTHIYFYPGVYTVSLVGYTAQGCRDTITYRNLITVQGPTGQFTLAPKTGCVPLNVSFSATPSSNTKSIVCDFGDGNILPDSTKFTHIYNDAKVFHPQFILTDYVGCSVSYPLDSVVTLSSPNIQGHDTLVCPGSIVTLASDPGTYTYKWVSTGGNINCDTCSSIKVTAQDNQAYILTVNNQNGCPGQATYHVNTESFPVLDSVAEIHLCKGDTATLFAGNAAKVIWSPATYLNNDSIANPLCSPLASTTYTVTAYSRLGCATSENISVVIKEKTDITVPQQIDACSDGTVQLNTTLNYGSDLGVHYMWSPALHLDNPTISDPVATIGKHDITYQVIASSGHCIPDTQSVTVHVHAKPDLEVSQSVVTTANAEVQLYAASHQQLTYHWYSNNDSFSCESCRHTNFYPTQSQVIYVEGTTALGCTVKDSVMVEIKGCDPNGIFMPNTFTPNGDGLNDKFRIRTNVLSSIKYFRIFDEWGNLVFETHNLDEAWDGSTNGKANQMGVYVYVLEGQCSNGSDVLKTGNVTALR
jgi:gliding motility-associated-like protein